MRKPDSDTVIELSIIAWCVLSVVVAYLLRGTP